MERINRELQRVVSRWLQNNFETNDLVTVTGVSVTRDLAQAVIGLQAANHLDSHTSQLNKLASLIKREIRQSLPWKTIPDLEFKADLTGDTIAKVESILDDINET